MASPANRAKVKLVRPVKARSLSGFIHGKIKTFRQFLVLHKESYIIKYILSCAKKKYTTPYKKETEIQGCRRENHYVFSASTRNLCDIDARDGAAFHARLCTLRQVLQHKFIWFNDVCIRGRASAEPAGIIKYSIIKRDYRASFASSRPDSRKRRRLLSKMLLAVG